MGKVKQSWHPRVCRTDPNIRLFFKVTLRLYTWKKGRLWPKNYFCTALRINLFFWNLYFWSQSEHSVLKSCGSLVFIWFSYWLTMNLISNYFEDIKSRKSSSILMKIRNILLFSKSFSVSTSFTISIENHPCYQNKENTNKLFFIDAIYNLSKNILLLPWILRLIVDMGNDSTPLITSLTQWTTKAGTIGAWIVDKSFVGNR